MPSGQPSPSNPMTWKNRKVLVTGADGFIGSHLAEALAGRGAELIPNAFTDSPEGHAPARRIAEDAGATIPADGGWRAL